MSAQVRLESKFLAVFFSCLSFNEKKKKYSPEERNGRPTPPNTRERALLSACRNNETKVHTGKKEPYS